MKTKGHLSILGKDYNDFKLQYSKQSEEEILVQRAVKSTIQIFYDKNFIENLQKADKVLKDFLFTSRCKPNLEELSDDFQ